MLKVMAIRIEGFRGFNKPTELVFDDGLNVVYGPNGFGKTSLAEALEWALFGETSRQQYARSKGEIKDSLANLHYPTDKRPTVELDLRIETDVVTVRRDLIDDNNSFVYVNGKLAPDLSSLRISREVTPNPVLAQHALREFLNTEPVNRWNALSQLLGLEAVSSFRACLQRAITDLQNEFGAMTSAVAQWELTAQSNGWTKLRAVLKNSEADRLDDAVREVVERVTGLSAPHVTTLEAKQQELLGAALAMPAAIDQAAVASEASKLRNSDAVAAVHQTLAKVLELWPVYIGLRAADVSTKHLAFIKVGLELPPEPPLCPFCGQETLTNSRVVELKGSVQSHSALLRIRGEVHDSLGVLSKAIKDFIADIRSHVTLTDDQETVFNRLLPKVDGELERKLAEFRERCIYIRANLPVSEESLNKILTTLNSQLAEGHDDPAIWASLASRVKELEDFANNVLELMNLAKNVQTRLAPVLASRVDEDKSLKDIAVAIALLRATESLRMGLHVRAVLSEAKKAHAEVEDYERVATETRLHDKETVTLDWYSRMNPNEDVRFSSMEVAKVGKSRQVQLLGETYGKRTHALALLSESHLNALGLSVHLARATSEVTSLGFLVLDDPVQSMDQAHTRRVASDLIGKLLQDGWQVIVLSHLKNFSDECITAQAVDRMEEITSYSKDGPKIKSHETSLSEYLAEVTQYKDGNSGNRAHAAHVLRKAVERFCKDVYRKGTGQSVPRRFQNKTVGVLKKLAVDSTKLSVQDMIKLERVLALANPASHDDQTVEPPTPREIGDALAILHGLVTVHLKG